MSELPEVALEIRTAREVALPLYPDSYEGPLLRVKYRPVGTRRWTSFLLVPEEGEHYYALEMRAADAVAAHRRQLRTTERHVQAPDLDLTEGRNEPHG